MRCDENVKDRVDSASKGGMERVKVRKEKAKKELTN